MRTLLLAIALLTTLSACGRRAPLEVPPPPPEEQGERR
ncbi:LPS translocon maturation chaperone LptM [Parvularcula oceani]|nr:lipoprotein [Parvularcula oceani]